MNISEAIRIALLSLWANKLRSFLTLLGIVIGVAAVIAVVTFESGINGYVAEKIFNLGADVFIVSKMGNVVTDPDAVHRRQQAQRRHNGAVRGGRAGLHRTARWSALRCATSPGRSVYGTQSSTDTTVRGWTPGMTRIYDLDLDTGPHHQPG